jgi:predicted esterase
MLPLSLVVGILALGAPARAQGAAVKTSEQPLPTGVVLPEVPEKADPSQTFALYLPPEYPAARRWPVIYAFDWAAHGKVPAELLYPAAAKRGYILIGSNNSRNGSAKESLEAAMALWKDTRERFAIDERQVYATGFSGAARSAFVFAEQCGCVNGLIAAGAGLPALAGPFRGVAYGVFLTLGTYDFNYPELTALEQQLDSLHVPNRLRRFDGTHQWPPAEILAEAVDWLQLEAMREGRRPRDDTFVAEMRGQSLERAGAAERAGDLLGAFEEYRKAAQDFAGLADVTEFASRAAQMKISPELQKAQKQEREDIERQKRMVGEIEQQLSNFPSGSFELGRRLGDITPMVQELWERAQRAKDPRDVRVTRRAISDVFAMAYESGLARYRQGNKQGAEVSFEVAAVAGPDSPGPHFELARVYASSGDKKRALRSLEAAVSKGLSNSALLRDTPEFAPLRGETRYQELVARLEHPH